MSKLDFDTKLYSIVQTGYSNPDLEKLRKIYNSAIGE